MNGTRVVGSARLAELVRAYRKRAGLTQHEAAQAAGISAAALRNLEQGRVTAPRGSTLRRLAAALRLSESEADELLEVTGPGAPAVGGLYIAVLGPLQISVDGLAVDLGSLTQRTLLGLLALSPNGSVSHDELIDAGWGSRAPARAAEMLQSHVSRLRQRLGRHSAVDARRLLTATPGGYRLCVDDGQVDVLRFEHTLAQARQSRAAGRPEESCHLYARCTHLWRGAPLADIPALRTHPTVVRLTRLWQDVVLEYAAVAAGLGQHREVLPLLRQLADADPLHEAVHARLMIALAASGQQASALEVFDRLRRRLAEELGAVPGRELSDAHQQVLRQSIDLDAAPVRALHQLPADIAEFTGRARELAQMHAQVPPAGRVATAVPVLAIQGMAGVGKTRLAVHFAHQLVAAGRYTDIQLYADLRANSDQPAANPAAVLATFLRQLGVPGTQIPDDLDGRATMYRDRLYSRNALVLLDDAATMEQVLPLVPGGPANLVLITSRRALALDGAYPVALDALPTDEAVALLGRMAGPDGVQPDPDAARQVVQLCGHLPLAIALAGRRFQARPGWTLDGLITLLSETPDRVEELSAGSRRLRAVFDSSYSALVPPTQRVFRLLGLHPGSDVTSESVAAMADIAPAAARRHLDTLVDEHLLNCDTPDRYRLHDLLRDYAAGLATEAETAASRREAVHRLVRWYLYAADRAREAMFPHIRDLILDPDEAPEHLPRFSDGGQAFRWLTAEQATMIAAITRAFDEEFDDLAWQLPVLLKHYFERSGQYDDWVETGRIALDAARRQGDRRAEGIVLGFLGVASGQLDRLDESIDHLSRAWRILDEAGDKPSTARALTNLGLAYRAQGRLAEAVESLRAALSLAEEIDERMLVIRVLSNLGWTYVKLGEYGKAIPALRRAYTSSQRSDDPVGVLAAVQHLGEALLRSGRPTTAIPYLQEALALNRRLHFRRYEAETLDLLGDALEAVGRQDEARDYRRQADDIVRELGLHRQRAEESESSTSLQIVPRSAS